MMNAHYNLGRDSLQPQSKLPYESPLLMNYKQSAMTQNTPQFNAEEHQHRAGKYTTVRN